MQWKPETQWPPIAILTVGFIALTVGIVSAHANPATGYEISIYAATPLTFWIGGLVALVGALVVVTVYRRLTPVALLLAGSSVLAVVSLPLIRGYYYYGAGDSLTHLGWTREIAAGGSPLELFYPGAHLVATAIHAIGFELRHAMLLVMILFVLVFVLFVPLTVRAVIPDRKATIIGAFSGLLLLPLFHPGTSYMFVPYTFAMLFSVFVLYLLFRHVIAPIRDDTSSFTPVSNSPLTKGGSRVLVVLSGATLMLFHSQLMADLLILLVTIAALQMLYRVMRVTHPIARHRLVALEAGVLTALFVAWNVNFGIMFRVLDDIFTAVTQPSSIGVAATVSQRVNSLQAIGGSLVEIFGKLFLVNAVFGLLAGGVVLAVFLGRGTQLSPKARQLILYLGVGGIVLLPLVALHFVGVSSSFFFRHIGFGMVLATILGAIAVYHLTDVFSFRLRWPVATSVTTVAIVLSLLVVFPSPYIFLANSQVTQAQMEGYEQTFDDSPEDIQFAAIRGGPNRYSSAFPGAGEDSAEGQISAVTVRNVSSSMIDAGIASQFSRDTYFVVTESDWRRELAAFRGLRYSEEDLGSISMQPGVSLVRSNGEFTLYYVDAAG